MEIKPPTLHYKLFSALNNRPNNLNIIIVNNCIHMYWEWPNRTHEILLKGLKKI